MFTWTEEKNQLNKRKHGFYLSEIYDVEHSSLDEDRYISIGCFHDTVILFVVTVDKADSDIQIISAREATPKEQEAYYDHYRKSTNSSRN